MASTETQKLADKIAKILSSEPQPTDLAALFASVEKINHRLDKLEQAETAHHSSLTTHHSPFSGAFSNFGPLNCLADRRDVAVALGRWVRPGGKVLLVLMGPLCPWEIGWHLVHGQLRPAFRRLGQGVEAHVGDGATIRVWYPSPRTLAAEFEPYFELCELVGICLLYTSRCV